MARGKRKTPAQMKALASEEAQPTKTTKTTSAKLTTRKPRSRNLRQPSPPANCTHRIVMLGNGLVSMETTPDYLVPAVERNATASPLLRLPPEIRNMIFHYAMGGSDIKIQYRNTKDPTSRKWHRDSQSVFHGRALHTGFPPVRAGTAFHLPETCRQVYSETATLGYGTNTFFFTGSIGRYGMPDRAILGWCEQLSTAQLLAITAIGLHAVEFVLYLKGNGRFYGPLKKTFPSLQKIVLTECTGLYHATQRFPKDEVHQKVKDKEGDDVEVDFGNTVIEDCIYL